MGAPQVTVIVLLYNDMPHGHRAIRSVLSQSYRDLKIKILDNGSTDSTWSEIQEYAERSPGYADQEWKRISDRNSPYTSPCELTRSI